MQHGSTVQVDPKTIQGQNQPITFHLQPVEGQQNPVRDVQDNLQGFSNWTNQNGQIQNFQPLAATAEQKPSVRILEQPASHKLRFRYQCEGRGAGALQGQFSTFCPYSRTASIAQVTVSLPVRGKRCWSS